MELKAQAQQVIRSNAERILRLSHEIHANPETAFQEQRAAQLVAGMLEEAGFVVKAPVAGLDTAFVASAGSGELHIGICAEYDALPGVGHACGHNIIAAAAVATGLALSEVGTDADLTVSVLGTPAEEGGGGKITMLDAGVFDDLHAALMLHPFPVEMAHMPCLAVSQLEVTYHGRAAHASAWPDEGVNAADALTVAQVAIGLLRQHIRSTDRVHGIVTEGGEAPNIVPERSRALYYVRAATLDDLGEIERKVRDCFEAGAKATGATVEIQYTSPTYSHFEPDPDLVASYRRNAEAAGRTFPELDSRWGRAAISTDMANVSLKLPAIHPGIGIDADGAVNHQAEFAARCATESADKAVLEGATALAWTAIDAATEPDLRERLLKRKR